MSAVVRIPKLRFDALAGYIRRLSSLVLAEELAWYEHSNGSVVGILIRDVTDDDFGGIVLGRDEKECFRCVEVTGWADHPEIAERELIDSLNSWSKRPKEDFYQGDGIGAATDWFTPAVSTDRLNPAFVRLAATEAFSPARALIEAMMHYYEDVDGNFVEQFQSSGFDARFWELYLFALLTEQGLIFDRSYSAPDFVCEGLLQDIFVEAVTLNPTRTGNVVTEPDVPDNAAELREYLTQYMPIKWGSALTSKLQKEYWKLPHVGANPIVLAVQDFHVRRAMTFTGSTLLPYLYGRVFGAIYDAEERLQVTSTRIYKHEWRGKKIESGFFYLPNAENVSAVIQNPTATLSKFNRMAFLAKMGSPDVKMLRFGTMYNPDSNAALPLQYKQRVDDSRYAEAWCEGLNVFHNPNALRPLDSRLFRDAMHHRLVGEDVVHNMPPFHPFSSETVIITPDRLSD